MLKPLLPLTELKITTVTTTLYSQIVLDIRSFLAQRGPSVFAMYSWMSVHLHYLFIFFLTTHLIVTFTKQISHKSYKYTTDYEPSMRWQQETW